MLIDTSTGSSEHVEALQCDAHRKSLPPGVRVNVVSRCSWTLYNFRRALLRRAIAQGAEVVALGACDDGFDRRLQAEGINVCHVPVSTAAIDPANDLRLLFALIRRFYRTRPDIVHAFTIKPCIYATLAAAILRVPVRVVTVTGLGHAFTTASPLVRFIVASLYRVSLACADVVFFQNRDDWELFVGRRLVDERAARLIGGSGVDLVRFRPMPLPSQSGAGTRFLMISRLLSEKGVREYLSAAERLKSVYPDARFRLLGGLDPRNPSSLTLTDIEALRINTSVEWIDEVDDVRPFIADADVIVLPSYREGLPRSLLEGAAMGRALIATSVPGCRDVVEHQANGYLVPPKDAEALMHAMDSLIKQPESIAAFGAHSRRLVESRFDENAVVEQTLTVYAKLLSAKT